MLSWDYILSNAIAFSRRWRDGRNEKAEAQAFILDFLNVFGVEDPVKDGFFEYKVALSGNRTGYIDFLWKGQIAIEMKSRGLSLASAFEQLRAYMKYLPEKEIPDLWMVCDFETIQLNRRSTNEVFNLKTRDLRKHIKRFANIAGYTTERVREDQIEVNVKAAEKMAKLHDALKEHGYGGHELRVYLVRLLFCLFADDTGIFPKDNLYRYIEASKPDGSDLSERIGKLFEVLNMPPEAREKRTLLSDNLKQFRYINGKLFADLLPSAEFNANMRKTLLDCLHFDWNKISPAIFGAMFQGVMDEKQRREMGAHYTSEENILKLINPLFMDELWKEFDRVKTDPVALERFHEKIARLKFLDPACGCGNFLIITYRELRMLELEILKMKSTSSQMIIDITPLLKVSVEQFYGIEYDDFPCQIAKAGMWLIDHQMNLQASELFGTYYVRLPLTQSATIVHANALRIEWESVVPKYELSYILGNPPFVGKKEQSKKQKAELIETFNNQKGAGVLDYVSAWYKKAAQMISSTAIRVAFVSTNSITQGEQPAVLWKSLLHDVKIDFAYRTFKWSNEAKGKAAVHCVIVGFSPLTVRSERMIYDGNSKTTAKNINPYFMDAPNVLIESRTAPLCNVPQMEFGNMPNDVKGLLSNYSTKQKDEIIAKSPEMENWFKAFLGAEEFINGIERWSIWLKDVAPSKIAKSTFLKDILSRIREERAKSTREATNKLAETPYLFGEIRQPNNDYILIPRHSSEKRKYIPIGFVSADIIAGDSNMIIPNATLYHFGILTSYVHNAWVRTVCGRLGMSYRYSAFIVYNNFPWPDATDDAIAAIAKHAQAVLDARASYPDSSLAVLYNPLYMPPELLKAHQNLDRAVMNLYGLDARGTSEADCVAALMVRYQELTA